MRINFPKAEPKPPIREIRRMLYRFVSTIEEYSTMKKRYGIPKYGVTLPKKDERKTPIRP